MLEILQAKDGSRTVRWKNVFLHSPYSPEKEARRFLETQPLSNGKTVILCGESLGYLCSLIRRSFPGSRILTVLYDPAFLAGFSGETDSVWNPGSPETLRAFLSREISLLESADLTVVTWPASDRLFPEISRELLGEINQFLLETSGSLSVFRQFGKKWFRNFLANLLSLETVFPLALPGDRPLVIASSGPSLEEALPFIRKVRDRVFLLSLPSSLEALVYAGLPPDLVLQTDPGYYAGLHLAPLQHSPVPVAMPPTASREIWRSRCETALFLQDSFFEKGLSLLSGGMFPFLPSTGTVAATALRIAGLLPGNLPVFIAGLDLANRDLSTHVRPHSFDPLVETASERTSPWISRLYERSFGNSFPLPQEGKGASSSRRERQTLPLKTYAGWLSRYASSLDRSLYRLCPSGVRLEGFREISLSGARELCSRFPEKPGGTPFSPPPVPREMRRSWASLLLREASARIEEMAGRAGDLSPGEFLTHPLTEGLLLPLRFLDLQDLRKRKNSSPGEFREGLSDLLAETAAQLLQWKGEYGL